jgi:hypothetical protein
VVSADSTKIVAGSDEYMMPVAECLLHSGNLLMVLTSFDQDSC